MTPRTTPPAADRPGEDGGREALADLLPVHSFDCDSFQIYNYGTRQGTCDCNATEVVESLAKRLQNALHALRLIEAHQPLLEDASCDEKEDCPACKAAFDKGWPPSGLCDVHYRRVATRETENARRRASQHITMRDLARAALLSDRSAIARAAHPTPGGTP